MSFPVTTKVPTDIDTPTTAVALNIGSPASGQMVTVAATFMRTAGSFAVSGNIPTPSGWTLTREQRGFNWAQLTLVLSKVCDGTEGATLALAMPANCIVAARAWVSNAGTFTGLPSADAATSNSTSINPPPLSPPGGAADYLWIAVGSADRFASLNSSDEDYSDLTLIIADNGGSPAVRLYTWFSERELNASSEDPDAFVTAGTTQNTGLTIAIQGTASGGSAIAPISSGYHLRGMR